MRTLFYTNMNMMYYLLFHQFLKVTLVGRKRWRLKPWTIKFFLYLYRGNINSALKAPKCFILKESFPNINFSQDEGKIDFYFGQAPLPVCETSSRTFCRTPPTWDKMLDIQQLETTNQPRKLTKMFYRNFAHTSNLSTWQFLNIYWYTCYKCINVSSTF